MDNNFILPGNNSKLFKQIIDILPDGVILIDPDSRNIEIGNSKLTEMLGFADEDFPAVNIKDILAYDDPVSGEEIYKKFASGASSPVRNIPVRTKNGSAIFTDITSSSIEISGKGYILAALRESYHQGEERRLKSDKRVSDIIDSSPLGAHSYEVVADGSLILTGSNNSADRILGIDHSGMIGKKIEEAFPSLLQTDLPERYRIVALTGKEFIEEKVYYVDDKINGAFDIHAFQTGFKRMTVFFQDITERKKSELALERNRELLRTILDTIANGILLVDCNRKITHYNRRFIEMWGIPDDVIGSGDDNLVLGHVLNKLADPEGFIKTVEYLYGNNLQSIDEIRFRDGRVFERYTSPLDSKGTKLGRIWDFRDISDRKRMEENLKNSEALLRGIFEASPGGVVVLKNRIHLMVNGSFCKITGYSREEIIGNSTSMFYFNEEEYNRVGRAYRDLDKEGVSITETRFRHKNGSELNVLVCLSRININDPDERDVAVILDITKLKQAEFELRESEEKFRSIVQNMQFVVYRCDLDGKITYTSPSSAPLLGCDSVESMIGRPVTDFYYYPEDGKRQYKILEENGVMDREEVVLKRLDNGEPVIVLVSNHFYRDRSGNIIGIEGVYSDITDRKRTEEIQRKNEAMLRTIFDASPAGILVLNNRVPIKVNRSFCRITGYSEDELAGKSTRHLYFSDEEYNRVGKAYMEMDNDGISMLEARFRKKDGSVLNVLICLSNINPDAPDEGDIAVTLDITELKKVEAEKLHLEEMLLHSQKIESIGRLAGGIAHDFNNLLTAISGNTEMAMRELDPDDKPYSRLAVIKKAAEGAVNLTKQLLAYSRKQIIEPRTINLNDLIEQMNRMLVTLLGENIKLKTVLAESLPPFKADPGQIEQVIVNLATNARDAMPEGGDLTIETSYTTLDELYSQTHTETQPGKYILMSVSDTGTGMSRDTLNSAFEPFFTTKEKGHGTGLGLSTVYGIIKQNGGSIDVYSEPGHGTLFRVYLPISPYSEPLSQNREEKPAVSSGFETVLVIEDNSDVLKFTGEILTQSGYRVLSAGSGEEGITISETYNEKIDLVITDVILPGKNGRLTTDLIRGTRPGIKVLFSSGYTAEVIDKHGILDKGINFISKPYTSQELTSKVRDILDAGE